ncbi:MAG: ribosome biogenesis GTP-binding protein YihA/YsxC [Oscillospiraceae bacterium]|nr:ribosome biogenesis GTP-binding protein YihA/YsxC [Oscillospiraceae bacterium]
MELNFHLVEFESSYGRPDQLPESDLPEIVFSGRSNVGKSSMINAIFNRRNLARVSGTPGKTATINFFRLGDIRFADLPGYGYAKVSKAEKVRWQRLMRAYYESGRGIALICQLVDMRHPPTADDLAMINFFIEGEFPFVIILTKADKLNKTERGRRREALRTELPYYDEITVIETSAETGEGIDKIRAIIQDLGEK